MAALLEQRLALLESLPDRFITRVDRAEGRAIREILSLLGTLETQDGKLVSSAANLERVDRIFETSRRAFATEHEAVMKSLLSDVDKMHSLSERYFGSIRQGFEDRWRYIITHGKENAVNALGGGLLSKFNQLRTLMDMAVTSGTTVPELAKQINSYTGLFAYAKTFAVDTLAIIDATYMTTVSNELGFEWFWYVGGIVQDSRCFCVERHNNYYHRTEVEAWGDDPGLWDSDGGITILGGVCKGGGRNPITNSKNIFILRGGYNCRHLIAPVSESVVPADVKARI